MTKNLLLRNNLKYAFMQGLYWALACSVIPFSGAFLLGFGYTNAEVGVFLAIGYIVSLLIQSVTASLADRNTVMPPAAFLAILCLIHILLGVGLALQKERSALLPVLFIVFFSLVINLQPHVNAFAMYIEQQGTPIRFGLARGCGSLFWGIVSPIFGALVEHYGPGIMPRMAIAADVVFLLLLFTLRDCKKQVQLQPQKAARNGTSYAFLRQYPTYLVFMLSIVLIFYGFSFMDNFPFQIVANVGGSSAQMGQLISVVALIELPAMFSFEWLRKKFGCKKLLICSAFFFAVKNVCMYLSRTMPGLYFAEMFHIASYSLLIPASVRYTDEQIDAANATKAQALLTMMMTVGNILSTFSGGWMIDHYTASGMLLAGAVSTVLGSAVMIGMLLGKRNKPAQNGAA